MIAAQLAKLRRISLLFLLPGLTGLILSAMISTYFLENLPRWPAPEEGRMTPESIYGGVVYESQAEDWTLSILEDFSVIVFVAGLGLGLLYLEKWGRARAQGVEEDVEVAEAPAKPFPKLAVWVRHDGKLETDGPLK